MMIVYLLAGLVVGVVVGYVVGLSILKKKQAAWDADLASVKKKLDTQKKELDQTRTRATGAEKKLADSGEEVGKLKQSVQQMKGQLQQAGSTIHDLEQKHATAAEAADAHKMARQQAEGRCRQAETMLTEAQQRTKQMEQQLEQIEAERANLQETGKRQTKELQRLRANVSSARGSSSGLEESVELFAASDGTLEGVLGVLLDNEAQNSAVMADANGIIVAAAGEKQLKEPVAATTQMIRTAVKQLEGMLPFHELQSYVLKDNASNVIAGRFFDCAGENVGLITFGPRPPSDRVLDGAMANLTSILE